MDRTHSSPAGTSDAVIEATLSPKTMTGFDSRLGDSGLNAVVNAAKMVADPGRVVEGAHNILYGGIDKALSPVINNPKGTPEAERQAWDAFAAEQQRKYGGWQNIKNTAYNDPVGVASDVSMLFGGAGSGLGLAGKIGEVDGTHPCSGTGWQSQ